MSELRNHDGGWLATACAEVAAGRPVVLASIIGVKGSAPRDVGAHMVIGAEDIWGTIGGGQLEFDAMRLARQMIAKDLPEAWTRRDMRMALGPDLGQCCGGQVRLLLEVLDQRALPLLQTLTDAEILIHPLTTGAPLHAAAPEAGPEYRLDEGGFVAPVISPRRPVFVYGAGHVGRALVGQLVPLGLDVHWVDVAADRFPATAPDGVRIIPAAEPEIIAAHAPVTAFHIVMTYSHAMDEAICARILQRGQFARLGLIGSQTKAARFRRRFAKMGIAPASIDRLVCPVGIAQITGKAPPYVALSIAAGIALWQEEST